MTLPQDSDSVCTSSSSDIGDSGQLLADMAGTGDWQDGMRFRSGVDDADVQDWVNGLGTVIAKIEYFGNRQGIGYPAFYVPFKVPEGILNGTLNFLKISKKIIHLF